MASTLSWQGRCAGSPINVADTMSAWGLSAYYGASDPNTALYAAIIQQANPDPSSAYYSAATPTPAGLKGSTAASADKGAGWAIFTEMCLRAKVILWAEKSIGDCNTGIGNPLAGLQSADKEATEAYQLATIGISTGANIAGTTASAVLGAAGSALVPVVGALIAPIVSLFAAHAKAVAQEQETLCQFSGEATQAIQGVYQYVESGQASGTQGYAAMQQIASSFATAVKGVTKSFCDGACGLNGTMAAHVALAGCLFGVTPAPGGVMVTAIVSTVDELSDEISANILPAVQPESAPTTGAATTTAATAVTATGFTIPTWALILLIGILILAVL